jgi:hypothetical protein
MKLTTVIVTPGRHRGKTVKDVIDNDLVYAETPASDKKIHHTSLCDGLLSWLASNEQTVGLAHFHPERLEEPCHTRIRSGLHVVKR